MFDEEFIFEVPPDEIRTLTLELLLFDYDEYSRHDGIGQVKVPLRDTDFEQKQIYWKPISQMEQQKNSEVSCLHSYCKLGPEVIKNPCPTQLSTKLFPALKC